MPPDERSHWIRIVIADADPRERARLRAFLHRHHDLRVVGEAGCGLGAVGLARQCGADAVVMDMAAAGHGPDSALAALCAQQDAPAVIVRSGFTHRHYRQSALRQGVARFLDKTLALPTLLASLRASVIARQAARPAGRPA